MVRRMMFIILTVSNNKDGGCMMRSGNMTKGFSLNELLVVMAILGLLIGIGVPASKMLTESFASSEGTVMIVGAALANARAIAMSNPTNEAAGVRFQQDAEGNQYMIFIIYEPTPADVDSFHVIEGRKPVRLPANAGVMDLMLGGVATPPDFDVDSDTEINDGVEFTDTTTFSIVFSTVGKLMVRDVRVRNRHGRGMGNNSSSDDVFNTDTNVDDLNHPARFYQDDYAAAGLGQEPSRRSFVVYDKKVLAGISAGSRYSGYLKNLPVMYVNPYTGDIIK